MSRQVKRVDPAFDWPLNKKWWGYELHRVGCLLCRDKEEGYDCPLCCGEKFVKPTVEPPDGDAWQMWEATSEGSPLSPPLPTAEALARWLADNKASAFGRDTATYEQWLAMIRVGASVSAVMDSGGLRSGVAAVSDP